MASIREVVDVEALLVAELGQDAAITALAADRVSTELPRDLPLPYLQLSRLPGSIVDDASMRVERARVQLSSWADNRGDALDLARAALRAIAELAGGSFEQGTVTGVDAELTPYWSPDPDTDTPRYLLTVALYVHA